MLCHFLPEWPKQRQPRPNGNSNETLQSRNVMARFYTLLTTEPSTDKHNHAGEGKRNKGQLGMKTERAGVYVFMYAEWAMKENNMHYHAVKQDLHSKYI